MIVFDEGLDLEQIDNSEDVDEIIDDLLRDEEGEIEKNSYEDTDKKHRSPSTPFKLKLSNLLGQRST